jgi:hypothetical protein
MTSAAEFSASWQHCVPPCSLGCVQLRPHPPAEDIAEKLPNPAHTRGGLFQAQNCHGDQPRHDGEKLNIKKFD